MPALRIVEAFDVTEDAGSGLLTGFVDVVFDRLGFERSEERFNHSVVIGVALARHTLNDAVGAEFASEGVASIL